MLSPAHITLLDQLKSCADNALSKTELDNFMAFIAQCFANIAVEDLTNKPIIELYDSLISHWNFVSHAAKEINLRLTKNKDSIVIELLQADCPFIVDSLRILLNKIGESVQFLNYINYRNKLVLYLEIANQGSAADLANMEILILKLLSQVKVVVNDWQAMRRVLRQKINLLAKSSSAVKFLQWLLADHFTFLGYAEYKVTSSTADLALQELPKVALGILPESAQITTAELSALYGESHDNLLLLGKTGAISEVHRPAEIDFVTIRLFNDSGELTGIARFIGLYTSDAYNSSPKFIPIISDKCDQVEKLAEIPNNSYARKELLNILETLPRDNLFYLGVQEIYDLAIGILRLQERNIIKLFINKDNYNNVFSCLVFIPRDRFNSQLRIKIQTILMQALSGTEIAFTSRFSESILARIHFLIRADNSGGVNYNIRDLEQAIIAVARNWSDDLQIALSNNGLWKNYNQAFSLSYQDKFSATDAVRDLSYLEATIAGSSATLYLYKADPSPGDTLHLKLFHKLKPIVLSNIVPILENMGLEIISERPYKVIVPKQTVYIDDYKVRHFALQDLNLEKFQDLFRTALLKIYYKNAVNDIFNKLILSALFTWREVALFRAYSRYLWQIGFAFSEVVIVEALIGNIKITKQLLKLFLLRFSPSLQHQTHDYFALNEQLLQDLELVISLTDDRILRAFMQLILATVRTNYYQDQDYIVYKIESSKVANLPKPQPLFEIFVDHVDFTGIHMRTARVARGGIRWSDREDFRTEVLGLMKAQQVKNSLIVPMGAKGGFYIKNNADPVACYKLFITGLLALTDNKVNNKTISPSKVVCHDSLDPYLVVAADKGTASFSDLANKIAMEHNFWLQDAFASGGSDGYDHKKMGITARGAWEAVKLHFKESAHDINNNTFTVIGIGDMAGDVFGNGMLLSKNIKLVAAFNHRDIFIDPDPDPLLSYNERQRLFKLAKSSWQDYEQQKISKGGAVFARDLKKVSLSPEIRKLLHTAREFVTPNELIKFILQAKVDLLWNGGVGTFIKASSEQHLEANDKINDPIRIDATELNCKIVVEGGNLGLTQLSRIEFAKQGGRINTDAVDNSAGVTCSDLEVNLKILLQQALENGKITLQQRNALLRNIAEEVSDLVLVTNKNQCNAITMITAQTVDNISMYSRVLNTLSKSNEIDLELEFLPNKTEIAIRKKEGLGLTRPEVAVFIAYIKNILKVALLNSDLLVDPYVQRYLFAAFPKIIQQDFKAELEQHPLATEIIATKISNMIVDEMDISFIYRLQDETGSSKVAIIGAYLVAREICCYATIKKKINNTANLEELNRLVRRFSRWLLRNNRDNINISSSIDYFADKIKQLYNIIPDVLQQLGEDACSAAPGVIMPAMFSALDIIEAARISNSALEMVAKVYFSIGKKLDLIWFRQKIKSHKVNNHWEALARAAFRDDLDRQQQRISITILNGYNSSQAQVTDINHLVELWLTENSALIQRWQFFIDEVKTSATTEFTMFAVALRELFELSN